MTVAKKTSKKNNVKKEKVIEVKAVEQKKEEVKRISNTQKCADMIVQLAKDAKHTRQEIVQTVSDALTALSVVTVKTMLSDLHNAKYAKRYSATTIKTDRETKRVSLDKAIV